MLKYTVPVYDEGDNYSGTLTFEAEDSWEADGIVDQYQLKHPGQYPDLREATAKRIATPSIGEVRLEREEYR